MLTLRLVRMLAVVFGFAFLLTFVALIGTTQAQDCRDSTGQPIECPEDQGDDEEPRHDDGSGSGVGLSEGTDIALAVEAANRALRSAMTLALSDAALLFELDVDPFSAFINSTPNATFASMISTDLEPVEGEPLDLGLIYLAVPNNDAELGQGGAFYLARWVELGDGMVSLSFVRSNGTTAAEFLSEPIEEEEDQLNIAAGPSGGSEDTGYYIKVCVRLTESSKWRCVTVIIDW